MKLTGETKFFIGVMVVTVLVLVGAVAFFSRPEKIISETVLLGENSWATGSAEAKVTLVEFSDFECPACGAAFPFVKQAIADYPQDLRFVFRHFPLDQHPNARKAAQVAEAAGAQGKFWEMHDLLFENQASFSAELFNGFAVELGLDMDRFTKDITGTEFADKVQKNVTDGNAVGVNSTPTFFLNGKKMSLFNFSELKAQIEKALAENK